MVEEEYSEVEKIKVVIEVPIIKHKVPIIGNRVQLRTSPYVEMITKLIILIHLKLSVIHVVGLDTTKMDVLLDIVDKTQTAEGLAEGTTARP